MTDDIVTRLRKQISNEFVIDHPNMVRVPTLYDQAADEIERLRSELNNASVMANAYYELVQAYKWSHEHLGEWPDAIANLVAENYNLRKAVRGD